MSFVPSQPPCPNQCTVTHPSLRMISIALNLRNDTNTMLDIRDANDAHIVLEAVRLNILPLIKRRLASNERDQLKTGNVFVWEEAEDDGGLLRWTDGRRWSQSRMRGDYLFYEEKVETTQEEKDAKAARRARRASDPNAILPAPIRRKDRPSKPNGLTKQTYSAVVHLPGCLTPKKWHVVAYFSGDDYHRLPVIETYDYLRNIRVPPGIYVSSKAGARLEHYLHYLEEQDHNLHPNMPFDRYTNQESPFYDHDGASERPIISSSTSLSSSANSRRYSALSPPSMNECSQRVLLPPLSSLGHTDARPHLAHRRTSPFMHSDRSPTTKYAPLSSEDRRVLDSFKVIL